MLLRLEASQGCSESFGLPALLRDEGLQDEELVEVTPDAIRLRKRRLDGWGRQIGSG